MDIIVNIGPKGSKKRDKFDHKVKMAILGDRIKEARQQQNLTQEQLGKLMGVQKAQVSKLEKGANSATLDTIIKVFGALKAEIDFKVKLEIKSIRSFNTTPS